MIQPEEKHRPAYEEKERPPVVKRRVAGIELTPDPQLSTVTLSSFEMQFHGPDKNILSFLGHSDSHCWIFSLEAAVRVITDPVCLL